MFHTELKKYKPSQKVFLDKVFSSFAKNGETTPPTPQQNIQYMADIEAKVGEDKNHCYCFIFVIRN